MANSYDKCLESDLPIVAINGLNTNKNAQINGTLGVTGAVTLGSTLAVSGAVTFAGGIGVTGALSSSGIITAENDLAAVAGGSQALGFGTIATQGIYWGSGAPTTGAATGSLYLRTDGSGTGSRAYISTGGTAWTAIITNA